MSDRKEPYDYEKPVVCVMERDTSIKVRVEGTGKGFFVPKSVIHDDSEVYKVGDEGKLIVHTWFAEEKEW